MPRRISIVLLTLLLLLGMASAKKKNKQELPDFVLNAQTVLVVIQPDAGEPVNDPMANRTAQDNVETAVTKWGRFHLVMAAQTADLIIAVRKGYAGGPTMSNSPADNRPVIFQPDSGDVRTGAQQGRPPGLTDPGLGGPPNRGPGISNQIGSSEDTFEVYRGGVEYPLDAPAIWRYTGKDSLNAPKVNAVEQFRKAVDDSEKQRQQKP
jgi:hypothetical protein